MTEYTNILEQYNKNENNYDDFQEVKPKAVEQMLVVYNNLCSLVNACKLVSNTDDTEKQLDLIIDRLRHNNYFNDYYEIDDNTYDVLYLDRDVNPGELDECTLTIHVDSNNQVGVANCIEFGIKGEDYPMDCTIQDVIYTLDKTSKL